MTNRNDPTEIPSLDIEGLGTVTNGLEVAHPTFGAGAVVRILQWPFHFPRRYSVVVDFAAVGRKMLSPDYARLRRAK